MGLEKREKVEVLLLQQGMTRTCPSPPKLPDLASHQLIPPLGRGTTGPWDGVSLQTEP